MHLGVESAIPISEFGPQYLGDWRDANYMSQKKYFLFLKRVSKKVFIRIELDDIWEERAFSSATESIIKEEMAFLADPDRWKKNGDHSTYRIDSDSEEKQVELTPWQKSNNYSKRAEYRQDGKLIGERAWHGNGQLAYESPTKDGLSYGVHRYWNSNGFLVEIRPYRKGRLHGILMKWSPRGNIDISFWMRGKCLSLTEYKKETKRNATLTKIKM